MRTWSSVSREHRRVQRPHPSTASMNCISSSSSSIEMAVAVDEPGGEEVVAVGMAAPSSLGRFTVGWLFGLMLSRERLRMLLEACARPARRPAGTDD